MQRPLPKPEKTFADYLVVAISPLLIMVLVGSLAFFLIQVFYRGEMIHGIRWVMFWFVLAIVLVSRVGIEQSATHAQVYGAALALTMLAYLGHTHKAPALGAVLLGITWWCAHKLTRDCTLINDDEDASGEGVLQGAWRRFEESFGRPAPLPLSAIELRALAEAEKRRRLNSPRAPGRWVIYFSLAALPLFGFGQLLLPDDDPEARRAGFAFLAVYLAAALSLLVTTSFLGLRRYLRQRMVEMPTSIAFGWIRFGVILAGLVLVLALLLPRPGAKNTWKNISYRIDRKLHNASQQAFPFNPPGEGEGQPANEPTDSPQSGVESRNVPPRSTGNSDSAKPSPSSQPGDRTQPGRDGQSGQPGEPGGSGQASPTRPGDAAPPSSIPLPRPRIPNTPDSEQSNDRGGGDSGDKDSQVEGQGRQPSGGGNKPSSGRSGPAPAKPNPAPATRPNSPPESQPQPPDTRPKTPKPPSMQLHQLLRVLLIMALAALFIWWLIHYRQAIAQAIRSFIAAVRQFFRNLFGFRRRKSAAAAAPPEPAPVLEPFAAYENPFLTGKDRTWPPERLLIYTYEAVQAWAKEQGIELEPQQTPREFCARLIERFPDYGAELDQFSFFYSHAAFAKRLPEDYEAEPIRRLWQYLGDSVEVVNGARTAVSAS